MCSLFDVKTGKGPENLSSKPPEQGPDNPREKQPGRDPACPIAQKPKWENKGDVHPKKIV